MKITTKELRAFIQESIIAEIGLNGSPYRFMLPRLDAIKKKLIALNNEPLDQHEAHLVEDTILQLEKILDLA